MSTTTAPAASTPSTGRGTMHFAQYYLDCLSQASYLVGDTTTGKAVVIDPRRDVDEYVRDAEAAGLTIEWVIETHFHADFLSGHLELAERTGATIGFGPTAKTEFASHVFTDGERIELGDVVLEVRHTPGHTPESISVVVWEHADDEAEGNEPWGVLTGDTLFIGDVGRPDLLAAIGYEKADLASMLYDSLHDKLLDLPDATRVWPAHGAGSACGKNLSTETSSTIGEQRRTNYALAPMTRDQFIDIVTEGQPAAPSYFLHDAVMNRSERPLHSDEALTQLSIDEVLTRMADGTMVIDTRDSADFAAGHLRGSVNVGLDGRFAEYAGSVIPTGTPMVLVAPDEVAAEEGRIRLARIGFDDSVGWLSVDALAEPTAEANVAQASRLNAVELAERQAQCDLQLIDIRNPGEVADGMLDGARHIPLAQLPNRLDELDPATPTVVYCAGGYRSSAAASLLRNAGFADVSDILGGYGACSVLTPASH